MPRYIDANKLKERTMMIGLEQGKMEFAVFLSKYIDTEPTADVVQKSEVAREIFDEIADQLRGLFDFFRQDDCIRESCAIMLAISKIAELKKKYQEGD